MGSGTRKMARRLWHPHQSPAFPHGFLLRRRTHTVPWLSPLLATGGEALHVGETKTSESRCALRCGLSPLGRDGDERLHHQDGPRRHLPHHNRGPFKHGLGRTRTPSVPRLVLILLGAEREGKEPPGAPTLSSSEVMSSSERPEEPSGEVLRREGRTLSASFMPVCPLVELLVVLVLLALREAGSFPEMSTDWGRALRQKEP